MILITRPKKESTKLALVLKKKKLKTFQEPLIHFKYLQKKIVTKEKKIFIVASSQSIHAINIKANQKNIKQASFIVIGDNAAKEIKCSSIVTFSGFDINNPLKNYGDINFWVNSKAYNMVENIHQLWLLTMVDLVIGKAEYSAN